MINVEEIKVLMDIINRYGVCGSNYGITGFEDIYDEAKAKLILKLKQL